MSTTDFLTPAQAARRIKHLEALLIEQVSRRGEPHEVRIARWEIRVAEAKRIGKPIPTVPGGVYTDPVWLETGEIL